MISQFNSNLTTLPHRCAGTLCATVAAALFTLLALPFLLQGQTVNPVVTTVKDTVYKSDGTLATGSVVISWDSFQSADSKPVFGGSKTISLNNGTLAVALVPNIGAVPTGTSYTVRYYQSGAVFAEEFWVVPNSSPVNPPTQPSIAQQGAAGSTTYCYWVSAALAQGETNLSPAGCTATSRSPLSSNNFNRISWTTVAGAANYRVFRTTTATPPVGTGNYLVGSTAALTLDDQSNSLQSAAIPEVNTTDPRSLQQVRVTIPPSTDLTLSSTQVSGTAIISYPTTTQTINAPASSGIPLQLRGQATNSGNLFDVFDNQTATTPKTSINSSGGLITSVAPIFSSFTNGSLLFAGSGGQLSQNSSNLFWDDSGGRLQVGPCSGMSSIMQNTINFSRHSVSNLNPAAGSSATFGILSQSANSSVYNLGAYSVAESSHSSGNRAATLGMESDAYHTGTGTINDLMGLFAYADNLAPAGGNATRVSAIAASASNSGSAATSELAGLRLLPNAKFGGSIANNFGLRIEDQTAGDVNWAIRTGLGKVEFGGPVLSADINKIRYASQFPGANAGEKIAAAIADLPATGGIVDARGLDGPQTAAATLTINKPVKLLIGATTLTLMGSPGIDIISGGAQIECAGEGQSDLRPGGNINLINVAAGPVGISKCSLTGVSASYPTATGINVSDGYSQILNHLRMTDWGGVPITIQADKGIFLSLSDSLVQPANVSGTDAIVVNGTDTTPANRHIHSVDTGSADINLQGAETTMITNSSFGHLETTTSAKKAILSGNRLHDPSGITLNGINHTIVGNTIAGNLTIGSTVIDSVIGPNLLVGTLTDNSSAAAGNLILDQNGMRNGLAVKGNKALPASTGTNLFLGSGYSSPVLGKIFVGDGTGWQLDFAKRNSSTDTTLFSLKDNGELLIGAEKLYVPAAGVLRTDSRFDINGPSTSLLLPQKASASTSIITAYVSGDSNNRIDIAADGKLQWGPGNAGLDTTLYRNGPDALKTDDTLIAGVAFQSGSADPADIGVIRLGNSEVIAAESSPTGTDGTVRYNTSAQWEFNSPIALEGSTVDANKAVITTANPTGTRTFTLPDANSNPVQPATCSGTDKVSAISSAGVITCSPDQGGSGSGGDNLRVEDGDNAGTFTAMSDADFDDSGDIDFQRTAGTPDAIIGVVRPNSVALTTDTTGNYVASVADGTGIDGAANGEGATYTPTLDLTEINSHTFGDNTTATLVQTFDPSGATNPAWSYSNGVANLSTGTLQQGGTAVALQTVTLTAGNGITGGGDLSANRTFDVAVTAPIEISADTVACSTCSTAANTQTFTNKTLDTEAAGNVLLLPQKIEFQAAGCDGTIAAAGFDLPTSNAPAKSCQGTSPHRFGTLDFADGASALTSSVRYLLPSDWTATGGVDIRFIWSSAATSTNPVVWTVQTACSGDGEDTANPSYNTQQTISDANNASASTRNSAAITGITMTGCTAGETLFLKIGRDPNNASDTLAATALLQSIELTIRRQI